MKLSKQQKEDMSAELAMPWGAVDFVCDGYLVSLRVERYKALSFRISTYVNGFFKVAWTSSNKPSPEQKFLRKSTRPMLSPAKRKALEKTLGKRRVAKDPFYSGSYTVYLPDWSTGKAAIAHLCKVSESIEVADKDKAAELKAAAAAVAEQELPA